MTFALGPTSRRRLADAHQDLQRVIGDAITLTSVDYAVVETARTVERQRELYRLGHTRTLNSRHIPSGNPPVAHAVDLAPFVGGGIVWEPFDLFEAIADAVRIAAIRHDVAIEWGAAWGRDLRDYVSARVARTTYQRERQAQGRKVFVDGPHFQIPWPGSAWA